MANNRMYLVHKETGEKLLLAKFNGADWWCFHDEMKQRLNDFFCQHFVAMREGDDYRLEYEQETEDESGETQKQSDALRPVQCLRIAVNRATEDVLQVLEDFFLRKGRFDGVALAGGPIHTYPYGTVEQQLIHGACVSLAERGTIVQTVHNDGHFSWRARNP